MDLEKCHLFLYQIIDTLARSLAEQTKGNKNENKCDICQGIFPNQNILKKHYEKIHGKNYFECKVCFARFNYQRNLHQHLEDSHEKKDPKKTFQCTKCPKAFATKVQMEGHICEIVADSNMLNYLNSALKCEKCKITFDNRPVHLLLSRFYPDFIQILSRFYPNFI